MVDHLHLVRVYSILELFTFFVQELQALVRPFSLDSAGVVALEDFGLALHHLDQVIYHRYRDQFTIESVEENTFGDVN